MQTISINEFIREHEIVEKIPYFGKARLYSIPVPQGKPVQFYIPREVFHFMTALYILERNTDRRFTLHINSFQKEVESSLFSDISPESNKRTNILEDPIFLGNQTRVSLEFFIPRESTIQQDAGSGSSEMGPGICNILVEYAKILPERYNDLHSDSTILVSHQGSKDLLQFRGNTP